jgi:hypothetical protein
MARNRKGPPHQAKHFQPEDHAHAAHQEEASRDRAQEPGHGVKGGEKREARKVGHPLELTPRAPSRGQ